ncbi:SAM-dependent methyltransferase [Halobacteriales archaeon SW_7_68_16]|nr:MAG: SAM-dependent methyltransferase [Halobacteriales archaeon SW_7_68_16]
MWDDDRSALADLDLPGRERVVDVGCGTGELTRVLREETTGTVVGCDADRRLLVATGNETAGDRSTESDRRTPWPAVVGDATRLPFGDGAVDLAVCQALLVNLSDPDAAVGELRRVSSDRVAAIEPDNGTVRVDSSVDGEAAAEARARRAFLAGLSVSGDLGAVDDQFERLGLTDVRVRRYEHVRTVTPPYDETALAAARRKASGAGIATERETMLAGGMTPAEYDRLRETWREIGRRTIAAMQEGTYRRTERIPFYVTTGRV